MKLNSTSNIDSLPDQVIPCLRPWVQYCLIPGLPALPHPLGQNQYLKMSEYQTAIQGHHCISTHIGHLNRKPSATVCFIRCCQYKTNLCA